jgi:hypothetical protein
MTLLIAFLIALAAAAPLGAQSIPGAVLAQREPHHHATFTDSVIRVLRVRVPAHDSTLLHEHDPDYFWIALGASDVVNVRHGMPDAVIKSADMSVHYTPGHFAHVARNPGAVPFDNITVELLRPQSNVRNLCEPAMGGKPLDCRGPAGTAESFSGAAEHPAFTTDQLRVSVVTLGGGATMRSRGAARTWLIALDTADTKSALAIQGHGAWTGGVYRANDGKIAIHNTSARAVRMLAVEQQTAK